MHEPFTVLSSVHGRMTSILVRRDWPSSEDDHFTPARLDAPHGIVQLADDMRDHALVMVVVLNTDEDVVEALHCEQSVDGDWAPNPCGFVTSAYVRKDQDQLVVRARVNGELMNLQSDRCLFCMHMVGGHYLADDEQYVNNLLGSRTPDVVLSRHAMTPLLDRTEPCWLIPVPTPCSVETGEMTLSLFAATDTHLTSMGADLPIFVCASMAPSVMQGMPMISLQIFNELYDVRRNVFTRSDVQQRMSLCLNAYRQMYQLRTGMTRLWGPYRQNKSLRSLFGFTQFPDVWLPSICSDENDATAWSERDLSTWTDWLDGMEQVELTESVINPDLLTSA